MDCVLTSFDLLTRHAISVDQHQRLESQKQEVLKYSLASAICRTSVYAFIWKDRSFVLGSESLKAQPIGTVEICRMGRLFS